MKFFYLLLFGGFLFFSSCLPNNPTGNDPENQNVTDMHEDEVKVHETIKINSFDLKVEQWGISHEITGPGRPIVPEAGKKFLVIHALFQNPHNSTQTIAQGTLTVEDDGRPYSTDNYSSKADGLGQGWGMNISQIGSQSEYRTKLVYEIPENLTGPAYWSPDNNFKEKRVFLGKIN